jgi:cold shock CspA family protein/ribosome-associated translation inhibitor RaiA
MNSIQITFRDIPQSAAVHQSIHDHIAKIKQHCDSFLACRVVLAAPPGHQHKGELYNVRITLLFHDKELLVNNKNHSDLYVAIHDSFQAMMHKAEAYAARKRAHLKTPEIPIQGTIARIFLDEGFGFIHDQAGNEYYFNDQHVLAKHFAKLKVGDKVSFTIVTAQEGLQAHHISLVK